VRKARGHDADRKRRPGGLSMATIWLSGERALAGTRDGSAAGRARSRRAMSTSRSATAMAAPRPHPPRPARDSGGLNRDCNAPVTPAEGRPPILRSLLLPHHRPLAMLAIDLCERGSFSLPNDAAQTWPAPQVFSPARRQRPRYQRYKTPRRRHPSETAAGQGCNCAGATYPPRDRSNINRPASGGVS
jgi:hypothetical protein